MPIANSGSPGDQVMYNNDLYIKNNTQWIRFAPAGQEKSNASWLVQLGSDQAITTDETNELVVFDSSDFINNVSFASGYITLKTPGVYFICATITMKGLESNDKWQILLQKDPAAAGDQNTQGFVNLDANVATIEYSTQSVSSVVSCASGDRIKCWAYTDNAAGGGAAGTILGVSEYTQMGGFLVS